MAKPDRDYDRTGDKDAPIPDAPDPEETRSQIESAIDAFDGSPRSEREQRTGIPDLTDTGKNERGDRAKKVLEKAVAQEGDDDVEDDEPEEETEEVEPLPSDDETHGDTEDTDVDVYDENDLTEAERLRRAMTSLAGEKGYGELIEDFRASRQAGPKTVAAPAPAAVEEKVEETEEEGKTEEVKFFKDRAEVIKFATDHEYANQKMNEAVAAGVERALRGTSRMVDMSLERREIAKRANQEFYDKNADLQPYKPVVAMVAAKVQAANPDKHLIDLLPEVAKQARTHLHLAERAEKTETARRTTVKKEAKPAFARGSGRSGRGQDRPVPSENEEEYQKDQIGAAFAAIGR